MSSPPAALAVPSMRNVRAVLLDAVGTVIYPRPAVEAVYAAAAARQGLVVPLAEVRTRFHAALQRMEMFDALMGDGRTSEARERIRWRQIVAEVFPAAPKPDALFEELWTHFSQPRHWALFDDASDFLAGLRSLGMPVGLASNFDGRLAQIAAGCPELADCRVFISSRLGVRKPHRAFFAAIERQLSLPAEQLLLVGDDLDSDYQGALAAGWQAVLLRRQPAPNPHNVPSLASLRALLPLLVGAG